MYILRWLWFNEESTTPLAPLVLPSLKQVQHKKLHYKHSLYTTTTTTTTTISSFSQLYFAWLGI